MSDLHYGIYRGICKENEDPENYKRNYKWRKYTGINPHKTHIHISFTAKGDTDGSMFQIPILTGEPNKHPVKCDWCGIDLVSYAGYRVQMHEEDPLDYNWACQEHYEKAWA